MILVPETLKIHRNGKDGRWRRGIIQLPAKAIDELGWRQQKVIVMILKDGEELSPVQAANLPDKIKYINTQMKQEIELNRVKGWKKHIF